ncbi:MAG: GspH/FimT family pseudopilin [Saccharospirillum sp.]|uniref:GspH/FimT family pseudopilin n=1 Tax=Saccharospirillum sp. TaxID=2033801 RepID=UPI0034A062CB
MIIKHRHNTGITAIELLLAIAITAVLASMAVPGFSALLEAHQSRTQQWRWAGILKTARHQAITRQRWVTLCPVKDTQCDTDLTRPWVAFFDDNRANAIASTTDIIAQMAIPEGTRLVMYRGVATLPYFRYRASGLSGNLRSLTVCPNGKADALSFHFSSTHLGHTRFFDDTNGDGLVDRIYQGTRQNIVC